MSKKKTIFVATSGYYSNYSIDAMFSTHELAVEFQEVSRQSSNDNIEEWILDEFAHASNRTVFRASINRNTGSIDNTAYPPIIMVVPARWSRILDWGGSILEAQSSVSQKHAEKLAVETRQEWLRKKLLLRSKKKAVV